MGYQSCSGSCLKFTKEGHEALNKLILECLKDETAEGEQIWTKKRQGFEHAACWQCLFADEWRKLSEEARHPAIEGKLWDEDEDDQFIGFQELGRHYESGPFIKGCHQRGWINWELSDEEIEFVGEDDEKWTYRLAEPGLVVKQGTAAAPKKRKPNDVDSSASGQIQLTVQQANGRMIKIVLDGLSPTVIDVKKAVQESSGHPAQGQKLFVRGQEEEMEDEHPLEHYGIVGKGISDSEGQSKAETSVVFVVYEHVDTRVLVEVQYEKDLSGVGGEEEEDYDDSNEDHQGRGRCAECDNMAIAEHEEARRASFCPKCYWEYELDRPFIEEGISAV